MKMYRLWLSAAGVALISAAGSAHALVFSAVTQSPPPGYQLTAAGQAAGTPPVTVTYTPTPTQGTLWNPNPFAADTFFNFNVDPGGNLVPANPADNTFGATFYGQPGGTATYTFSQPVVGDAATGLTRLTTLSTMQHASFRFTLQGGAVWTSATLLPAAGACTPPAQVHGLTAVSGLGTPVLTFTRPVGSTAEGCDDYALVASGPFTTFQIAAVAPVNTLFGFIPNETLRARFTTLVQAPAAASGGLASVPTVHGAGLAALAALMGLAGRGRLRHRMRRRA